MDFIIDRTNEDVMYAQSLVGAIWSKMTNAQKEEWLRGTQSGQTLNGLKGFFNFTDMRRIKANYNSLRTTYSYSGASEITTTYSMSTLPNRTTMSEDFQKIQSLGNAMLPQFFGASFSDYRTPFTLSYDVNKIDYNFINNYEHILKNLYDYHRNHELNIECEFIYDDDINELDGYFSALSSGEYLSVNVPSGYLLTIETGVYYDDNFIVNNTNSYITNGEPVTTSFSESNYELNLKIESGIQNNTLVGAYGTAGNTVDVTNFDTVRLDCDMLKYGLPTTYTATEIQSSMIDVSSLTKMYCYDISVYGENTLVSLYDENQDEFDEVALREDTFIDLTNASYITFDTDVGTEITYITTDATSFSQLYVTIDGTTSFYPDETEFDVSEVNSIKIFYPAPYDNRFVCEVQKSIEGGKDLSQLNTDEIEVKYI